MSSLSALSDGGSIVDGGVGMGREPIVGRTECSVCRSHHVSRHGDSEADLLPRK